ncbi:hypothetical protein U14_02018 [Candidatus Moduliflexus flocculans]|uniref:Uncharacterized protein n=1 Tax=Candidatus Moduliflexus flocculans TaxID=1499966 RepID=A0A0S6VY28_9BACT|nr:hypothetical protein U14_02018 [Candidatus Moduliflexus flocculans]
MGDYLVSVLSKLFGQNEFLFRETVLGFLGWLNVLLALVAASLFTLRRVNKHWFANKNATIKNLLKPLSKAHPYIGAALLICAYLHGDIALGTIFKIHTGPLTWWIILVMMLVALIGKKYKVKNWLPAHRILAGALFAAIFLHLFFRNIL